MQFQQQRQVLAERGTMTLSSNDKICLERLFSYLASSLDGLVTTVAPLCFAHGLAGLHDLLTWRSHVVRSVVVVIEGILAEDCKPWHHRMRGLLDSMLAACAGIQDGLFTLERFRTVQSDELHHATKKFQQTYEAFSEAIRKICDILGLAPSHLQRRTMEVDGMINRLLQGLSEYCEEARRTGEIPAAFRMPTEIFESIVKALNRAGLSVHRHGHTANDA
jgi:hypothetical protein